MTAALSQQLIVALTHGVNEVKSELKMACSMQMAILAVYPSVGGHDNSLVGSW